MRELATKLFGKTPAPIAAYARYTPVGKTRVSKAVLSPLGSRDAISKNRAAETLKAFIEERIKPMHEKLFKIEARTIAGRSIVTIEVKPKKGVGQKLGQQLLYEFHEEALKKKQKPKPMK